MTVSSFAQRMIGRMGLVAALGVLSNSQADVAEGARGVGLGHESTSSAVKVCVVGPDGVGIRGASLYSTRAGCELLGRTDEGGRATVQLAAPSRIVVATEHFQTRAVECESGQSALLVELASASFLNASVNGFRLPEDQVSIEVCDPSGRVFRDASHFLAEARLAVMGVKKAREHLSIRGGAQSYAVELKPVRAGPYCLPDVAHPALLEFRLIDALGQALGESVRAHQAGTDAREWSVSMAPTRPTVRPTVRVVDGYGQALTRQKLRVFAVAADAQVPTSRVHLAAETDARGKLILPPLAVTLVRFEERTTRSSERRGGELLLREGQLEYEVALHRN